MELANIEKLLEKYFDATTSTQEEQELTAYFTQDKVAPHLLEYKPVFEYFSTKKEEQYTGNVPLQPRRNYTRWISVAAVVVLLSAISISYFTKPDRKEVEIAFAQFKETMTLVSEKLNNGASQINYLNQFEETKNKIFITRKQLKK